MVMNNKIKNNKFVWTSLILLCWVVVILVGITIAVGFLHFLPNINKTLSFILRFILLFPFVFYGIKYTIWVCKNKI